jgi:hypothetical protein
LVPLKPNELNPAIRGPLSGAAHGVSVVGTVIGSSAHGMYGLGLRRCRCGGTSPCCSASRILIRPAMPAADSRWPMLVFTEPIISGRSAVCVAPKTAPSARISIGSPSGVPVPCAST